MTGVSSLCTRSEMMEVFESLILFARDLVSHLEAFIEQNLMRLLDFFFCILV